MDGNVASAPLDGDDMVEQRLWPAGEMRLRLAALGYSVRAFADEIGEHETLLRQLDSGKPLTKRENIARRAELFLWIEKEERLREFNPLPAKAQAASVKGWEKQRRRPRVRGGGSPVGEVRAMHPSELPEHLKEAVRDARMAPEHERLNALVEPSPVGEVPEVPAGAGLADRMAASAAAIPLVLPEVSRVEPVGRVPRQLTAAEVRRVYDYVGLGPRELARRAGAPELYRDLRRWANREGAVKPDAQEWLARVEEASSGVPEVAEWQRRVYAFHAWRGEIERRLAEAWERLRAEAPPEDRVAEWERRVDLAASDLPHWMRPKPKDARGPVPNPRGPMTLDEIL